VRERRQTYHPPVEFEQMASMAGIAGGTSARRASIEAVRRRLRHRLPWLLLALAGAVVAAKPVGLGGDRDAEADQQRGPRRGQQVEHVQPLVQEQDPARMKNPPAANDAGWRWVFEVGVGGLFLAPPG
jgi:hypothetical protein